MCSQGEVVVLLPREAREVVDDHEVDLALVRAAVLQQRLELAAVRGLGALAFFVEAFEDVVALPAAVLLAGPELGGQTEVLGLLLRADAYVDHRADHLGQLSPVSEPSARSVVAAWPSVNATVLQRQGDQHLRHRFRVARDVEHLVVRQCVGLVAEQFAASRDRDRFRNGFRRFGHVHGGPPLHASRVDWVGALRRVDVAVDAPLSRSADAALRRHRPRKLCSVRRRSRR